MAEPNADLSKNELKRRLKSEKKAKEKANKVALHQIDRENSKDGKVVLSMAEMKKSPKNQSEPQKFHVSTSLEDFVENYSSLKDGEILKDVSVSVAGRVHAIRKFGAKLIFCDLRSISVKLQVMADAKLYESEMDFLIDTANLLRGDIIGINGYPGRTIKGELSIIPKKITQLYNLATLFPLDAISQE